MAGFYFRHDFNASKDPKLQDVRMQMGSDGYGVYWLLLEALASSSSHKLSTDYNKLGWELHLDSGKIKRVVCDFGLFKLTDDGGFFYSERLKSELDALDRLRDVRREAGIKGNESRWGNRKCDENNRKCDENNRKCDENNRKCDTTNKNDIQQSQTFSEKAGGNADFVALATDSNRKPIANATDSYRIKENKIKENINSKVVVVNGNTTRMREAENPTDSTTTTSSEDLFSATNSTAKQSAFPPIVKTPQQTRKTGEEFEYWREGEYSYTPEFLALLDAIGARFNQCDGRVFAQQLESILRVYQQTGVKDGMQVVRNALAKSETAEFLKSGKYELRPTKFLTLEFIAKLTEGSYDKIYPNNNNKKQWKDAGLSFENMTY